jgi:hypothetical protein
VEVDRLTIAILAPEKFAFQDLVCIELGFSLAGTGLISLLPEPQDGEDALLTWVGNRPLVLEVQVKGARGKVSVSTMAAHLAHYPNRKATDSLLQRLIEDTSRGALFVMSGRCVDALMPLVADAAFAAPPSPRDVPVRLARELQAALRDLSETRGGKGARLARNRCADMQQLASQPRTRVIDALTRVFIVERQNAANVEVRLHEYLRGSGFDSTRLRGVVAALANDIATAKRLQMDAFGPIQETVRRLAPSAVEPERYVSRGNEDQLLNLLDDSQALLLAGPPRIGKSWTARAVAGRLQRRGFEVRLGAHIDEAERFLTEPTVVERAYMLDDPFGSREPLGDASLSLANLRRLLATLSQNRRLIVAQAEHVLLQLRGAANLAECGFEAHQWTHLEPLDVEHSARIWRAVVDDQGISGEDAKRVATLLQADDRLHSPGALAYLAQTFADLPATASDEEIVMQASKDASDFARVLAERSQDLRDVLQALAVATDANDGAVEDDIAFVIDGDADRPGLMSDLRIVAFSPDDSTLPAYAIEKALTHGQMVAVETLERRRILEQRDGRFNFSHPYLRAGAQSLLQPDIPKDGDRIIGAIERGIACLSPITSLSAARNLRWLKPLVKNRTGRSAMFDVARSGMRSIFPATRDECFAFLLGNADELDEEARASIPTWSEQVVVDVSEISVDAGVAFIGDHQLFLADVAIEDVQPYLDAVERGEVIGLDLVLSKRILSAIHQQPAALTSMLTQRLLRADEALVRADAARLWCDRPRQNDEDILNRLTRDAVPVVSIAVLRATAVAWANISVARREALLRILLEHGRNPSCASVLFTRLQLFNRVEHFGSKPRWTIFSRLMPTVLRGLPPNVSFESGRFNATIDSAIAAGVGQDLVEVLETWIDRLLSRLQRYLLTENDILVVRPLLAIVPPTRRLPALRRLLRAGDTGVRVVVTAEMVDEWYKLAPEEQRLLRDALAERAADVVWLKATVLTGSSPPFELVAQLAGRDDALAGPPQQIERMLGPNLFEACARMFMGSPQPLWWFGKHHRNETVWRPVIRWIATIPEHSLHAAAFSEVASFDDEIELVRVVATVPEKNLDQVFRQLLQLKLATVGDWHKPSWERLLERGRIDGHLDNWFECIEGVLDGVLEDLRDIFDWLGDGDFTRRLLTSLSADIAALHEISGLQRVAASLEAAKDEDAAGFEAVKAALGDILAEQVAKIERDAPRLHGTWSAFQSALRALGAGADIISVVENHRLAALERHHTLRERASATVERLRDWIDLAASWRS